MRAAVIGLGWWGKMVVRSLAGSQRITVTHGVDRDPAPLRDFADEFGVALGDDIEAVMADPAVDAVIVTAPNSLHESLVMRALAAGKQVFCEKPLTLDMASATRMINACDKAGIVLGIGHERRWEPAMQALRRHVQSGAIGRPLHVETNFSHSIFGALDADNWRFDLKEAPGAGFTGRGIHLTDFLVWLFGPARAVWATTAGLSSRPPRAETVAAHVTLKNGMTALVSVLTTTPFYGRFTVFGDAGWIEAREPSNAERDDPAELVLCDAKGKREMSLHPVVNTVAMNFEAWADAVAGRADYPITTAEILANMQIFEAIVRSAESGAAVGIEPPPGARDAA